MTVYGSFDLEDDDFFNDTFRCISDSDLSGHQTVTDFANGSYSKNNSIEKSPTKGIENDESSSIQISSGNIRFHHKNDSNKDSESAALKSRFTPGFTPKVKKRKFPGPAGIFSDNNEDNFQLQQSKPMNKKIELENEMQDITYSQPVAEDLLLPSWQTLQAEVSSKGTLSTAKYYSINRVYKETSKKKLPKHIVVPLLCVLLKKFNHADSDSIFIDDTGEIPGKIEKPVLSRFGKFLMDGVALILKKVTFLCNVLVLTEESIASMYFVDGTAKHFQEVDLVPLKEEPLKPMSCPCSHTHTAKVAKNHSTNPFCNSSKKCEHMAVPQIKNCNLVSNVLQGSIHAHPNYKSPNFSELKSKLKNGKEKVPVSVPIKSKIPENVAQNLPVKNQNTSHNSKNICFDASDIRTSVPENSPQTNNSAIETADIFDGNTEFDDFDELLGNLDEESFMEEF